MKRVCLPLALVALSAVLATSPVNAQSCSIGGHNETSENFAPGGWATINMTPGTVPGAPSGTHLVISEVAPRGAGTGAASDSSEFVEIYNPTTKPVLLDGKYISDEINYYRIVNGPYLAANNSDWALKFPPLTLLPGRTLVLCVTKAGFLGSGASPGAAQHFLEMKDSNGNTADDMILMTTNSTFPVTGGCFTNPSGTNGEYVVLYCWNGQSDLVCDIDYASFGANSASNPKVSKTGVSIDGPDANTLASAYNADTPAATQTNLGSGTALTKPLTYQRTGGESGEATLGGNGCLGIVVPIVIDWVPVASGLGEPNIRFHIRWQNPDEDAPSSAFSGTMFSQEFGVFLPNHGTIGDFNVPPLQPSSFFDVFVEVPLSSLPPKPQKMVPGGGGGIAFAAGHGGPSANVACPPDTNWAGNVDVQWGGSGSGQGGQVNVHYGDLITCPGGDPSLIHVRPSNCTSPMPWSTTGVCPGWTVTLVNEDFSPAPNPIPVGWSGWIKVTAVAGVPSGASCCFGVVFGCNGATSTINICSTACDCATAGVPPTLSSVNWTLTGTTVTFHQHWENPSATLPSDPVSGTMSSQELGVFLPNYGPIGPFAVPSMAPGGFFDIFVEQDLAQLPPEPEMELPSGLSTGTPCLPAQWHGNVDLIWQGAGGTGNANYHFDEVPVCAESTTYVHIETGCASTAGATWSVSMPCPGFTATLVNLDHSPAPNPLPNNWIGLIAVSAAPGTAVGTTCCFNINFLCDGEAAQIKVCAKVCNCNPRKPRIRKTDWSLQGSNVLFHMQWENPSASGPSEPVSGDMHSQPFGAFVPNSGTIGHFDVPPIPPSSFFDVFLEVPLSSLPPEPQTVLPGGGPGPGSPCPQDTSWSGNVDIMWGGQGGAGQTNYHFTELLVRPGATSHVHALIFCNSAAGAAWNITGLCPGYTATLLNENFTPAPNPVPANWTGWISVGAAPNVPAGSSCCFSVHFVCDGEPATIDVCAEACVWTNTDVPANPTGVDFGIYSASPNPTSSAMSIGYAMPKSGNAQLAIYNLSGQRVRTLLDGRAEAGMNAVRWDGRGENGRRLPPGAYFVTLRAGERVASKKIVLVH